MGCDCCGEKEKAIGKITDNDKRSCTDIPFLLLFMGFWAAIIILMAVAIQGYGGRQPANMNALLYGTDYNGVACGQKGARYDGVVVDNTEHKFVAFPYLGASVLNKDTGANIAYTARICVSDCNQTQTDPRMVFGNNYRSTQYVNFCMPADALALANSTMSSNSEFSTASAAASRAIGDLFNAWQLILGSVFLAMVLAVVYLKFVQCAAGFLVWTSILLVLAGGVFISYTCLQMVQTAEAANPPTDPTRLQAMKGVGITCAIITFFVLLRHHFHASTHCDRDRHHQGGVQGHV